MGPQQGRKVFTLQMLPPDEDGSGGSDRVAKEAGFSLHAGVSTEAHQRDKLERLCRYVTRPAVSEKRLAITSNGNIRYQLKTPYRDGTTHFIFEPLDFIAKLAEDAAAAGSIDAFQPVSGKDALAAATSGLWKAQATGSRCAE